MRKLHYHIHKGKVACGARVRAKDGEDTGWTSDPLKVTCLSCRRAPDVNAMLLRDKVTTYEALLHQIHFNAAVAMNAEAVGNLIKLISDWSFAHRCDKGLFSDQEQAEIINQAYEKLKL